jgi:hypothetical protein
MAKNANRCWPGYEPVKGKQPHEQGSCRPKAEEKLTAGQKEFRRKRAEQLAKWKKQNPGSPTKAAQHLRKPATKKGAARSKAAKTAKSSAKR